MTAGRSLRSIGRWLAIAALALLVIVLTGWCVLALYYSNLPGEGLRIAAAAAFALGTAVAFACLRRRLRTALWFFVAFAAVLAYWWFIPPRFDRDWAPDVAVMPDATIDGDRVTIRNVRNFRYRSESDFDVAYEDRTYDLSALESVDLFLSYWDGNRAIAHMMVSFGFTDGRRLAISIETRKEKGEGYSAIAGFFKQYELIYVAADERDVVELRTNHRREDVYLYPMVHTAEHRRRLFLALVERIAEMAERPEWYNAFDDNCTTAWLSVTSRAGDRGNFDRRLLLNGWFDELAYERGSIVADESHGLPYEAMRAKHAISAIAQEVGADPAFSRKVRARLPKRTP